jgi:hypothetical protein
MLAVAGKRVIGDLDVEFVRDKHGRRRAGVGLRRLRQLDHPVVLIDLVHRYSTS